MVRLNQLLWFGEEFTGYRWTVWLLSNDVWTYVNCKWITSWKHASYETVIETCYIGADLFKWHRDCIISAVLLCLTFYQAFWKSRISIAHCQYHYATHRFICCFPLYCVLLLCSSTSVSCSKSSFHVFVLIVNQLTSLPGRQSLWSKESRQAQDRLLVLDLESLYSQHKLEEQSTA